jgi:hypothetical protein
MYLQIVSNKKQIRLNKYNLFKGAFVKNISETKKPGRPKTRYGETVLIRMHYKAANYVEHVRKAIQKSTPRKKIGNSDAVTAIFLRLSKADRAIYETMKD